MSVNVMRSEVFELLNNVKDEKLIEVYRDIFLSLLKIDNTTIIGHSISGEPLNVNSLKKEVLEAQERMKAGNYIAHKDVKNKI